MQTLSTPSPTGPPPSFDAPFFSPARREGDWIFVSGQMSFDAQWRIAGDTVGEQTRICLARIDDILKSQGLGIADVVKTTVWLTRVSDFAEFNRSYAESFSAMAGAAPAPARSTVRADLMVPDALVEIDAVARCRRAPGT